jgi:hypothetical protein
MGSFGFKELPIDELEHCRGYRVISQRILGSRQWVRCPADAAACALRSFLLIGSGDVPDGIQKPILGKLDQGTLFSCAMAEDYRGCTTFGLVITARCDVDRERAPVINYLPVVPMDEWVHRDGTRILRERARSSVMERLGTLLKQLGYGSSILETEKLEAISEKIIAPLQGKRHDREIAATVPTTIGAVYTADPACR